MGVRRHALFFFFDWLIDCCALTDPPGIQPRWHDRRTRDRNKTAMNEVRSGVHKCYYPRWFLWLNINIFVFHMPYVLGLYTYIYIYTYSLHHTGVNIKLFLMLFDGAFEPSPFPRDDPVSSYRTFGIISISKAYPLPIHASSFFQNIYTLKDSWIVVSIQPFPPRPLNSIENTIDTLGDTWCHRRLNRKGIR